MDEVVAFIGLGSNLGEREANISRAVDELRHTSGVTIYHISTYLETEPVGVTDQPKFINCVVKIRTTLDPFALRDACLAIETRMGRVRRLRWGPRLIDLDILLYGDLQVKHPELHIPHPEIGNRDFVQAGLRELGAHG